MRKNNTARKPLQLVEPTKPTLSEVLAKDPIEFFSGALFYDHDPEEMISVLWTLLSAIESKPNPLDASDYCYELKRALFTHSYACAEAMKGFEREVV